MKTAIITGITGQDGAYLAELLLSKGYKVYGTYRRTSSVNFWRIEELGIQDDPNLHLVEYDLTDLSSSIRLLQQTGAKEIYNLAAQSFVGVSFDQPITTAEITGVGARSPARGDPHRRPQSPLLPGQHVGDVRPGPGSAAGRNHGLLPPQPLWGRKALRPLDDRQLPRELWHLRCKRDPVQSRKPAARPRIRDP